MLCGAGPSADAWATQDRLRVERRAFQAGRPKALRVLSMWGSSLGRAPHTTLRRSPRRLSSGSSRSVPEGFPKVRGRRITTPDQKREAQTGTRTVAWAQ